jgi:LacI family transcriptional regulator
MILSRDGGALERRVRVSPASSEWSLPIHARDKNAIRASRRVLFITDFYIEEVLSGIVEYAREAGWELIANMRFHGLFPSEKEADGILTTVTTERVRDWLLQWRDCPTVRMIASPFADLPYPAIEGDYAAAGRAGAEHLLELGHVHYAFYWLQSGPELIEAVQAFESVLTAAGRRLHRLDFPSAHGGKSMEIPREERLRWLTEEVSRLPKPVAIMGDDDRRALELVIACEAAGLRVPEDVALLGCDNRAIELGTSSLPISSVDLNMANLGWEAAELLDRIMRGEAPPRRQVNKVPVRGVVARRSTATFVTDSPGITAALLHLRERFQKPLRMSELARVAGMSERLFGMEFKRRVGRSPRAEIQRARLACAARLLRDTDLKLDAIAVESGFGSARKLCTMFAEAHGATPTVWRNRVKFVQP